jgi:hypothetical protein
LRGWWQGYCYYRAFRYWRGHDGWVSSAFNGLQLIAGALARLQAAKQQHQ